MKKILLALAILGMVSSRASALNYYWDFDTDATGNDGTTGTNLGNGPGTWDNLTTSNWWDGSSASDTTWDDSAGSGAIFTGTASTVTLDGPRTASSLTFASNGYLIAGSTLSFSGPATIKVDASAITGLQAYLSTKLIGTSGYNVTGGGILNLNDPDPVTNPNVANTITGPISVTGGSTLSVTGTATPVVAGSDRIGGATGNITLDGGTIRNTDAAFNNMIPATRNVIVGTGGGTFDIPNSAQILFYGGTISGAGNTLTKTGAGEIRMNGTTDFSFEKVVISGLYGLGQAGLNARDGQLGAVPATFKQDQITIDSGGLRFNGGTTTVLNANRGITINSGGGTLIATSSTASNGTILGKITGPGSLTVGTTAAANAGTILLSGAGNDWAGSTTLLNGTLRMGAAGSIASTPLIMNNLSTAIVDMNGFSLTVPSLASLTPTAANGGNISLGGGTLTVGDNSSDTQFNGTVSGAGTFIKVGSSRLTFNNVISTNVAGVIVNVFVNDGTLRFNSNNAGLPDAGLLTINAPGKVDMGGGDTIVNGVSPAPANDTIGDLAGDGELKNLQGFTAAGGLIISGNRTTTFSGVISGGGGIGGQLRIAKTAGSLTLTGTNTYTNGTTVTQGRLFINNTVVNATDSGTGTGVVTISGGTSTSSPQATVGGTGRIGNTTSSGVTMTTAPSHLQAGIGNGNATLTTTKVTTTISGAQIDSTLGTGGNADVLRLTHATAPLSITGSLIVSAFANSQPATGVYTVIDTDVDLTSVAGSLVFNNATGYDATMALNITGDKTNVEVTVTGTTLQDREWASNTNLQWSASAPLANWTGSLGQPNGPSTTARFGTNITAPRTVTITDTNKTVGTLIFDNSTNAYTIAATTPYKLVMNTYDGSNAAINLVHGTHTITAGVTLNVTTDLNIETGKTLNIGANWNGNGTLNINSGTLSFNGVGAAGLMDTGLVNINGATTTLNMTTVGDQFGDLGGDGNLIVGGSGTAVTSGLRLAGALSTTFSGTITGSSFININKTAGSLSLTNNNGNSGNVQVNAGTLYVNNPNLALSGTGSGAVVVAAGAIAGGAPPVLAGTGSIGGPITVNSGGTVAPGNSIGTLTARSGLTLNTGSILNFELSTDGMGNPLNDKIDNTNSSNALSILGGTLNIIDAGAMKANNYTLIDYSGVAIGAAVNNLKLGTQPAGFFYKIVDNAGNTSVDLRVRIPGDYNDDGLVDAGDYAVWRKAVGQPIGTLVNDANTTGTIGDAQYTQWRSNFGKLTPAGAPLPGLSAAVPEPSTLVLALAGLLFAGCRRRR